MDFGLFFDDPFFSSPLLFPHHHHHHHGEPSFQLSARDTDKEVIVELEVPRFRGEDIKVATDAERGLVTISGRREATPASTGRSHTNVGVSEFKRSFTISPQLFELAKLSSTVDSGLLTITIPRKEQPKAIEPRATPLQLENKSSEPAAAPAANAAGGQVATTGATGGEVAPFTQFRHWPPKLQVVKSHKPGVAVTYRYDLPPTVPAEHVKVEYLDNNSLRVDVAHTTRKESEHGFEEHSASFTRMLALPDGTKPEDVVANYKDGHLSIEVKEATK